MAKIADAVRPVYAVVGSERFLRAELIQSLLASLEAELDPLGPTRLDGGAAALADVLDEVRTMSLLGARRAVIVDDADEFITANRAALERYCAAPSDSGILIFVCDSLPKTTRLYKIINTSGTVLTSEPPQYGAVSPWIIERAQRVYKKSMNSAAASRLRELIGDDPGRLDSEIAKLAAYAGQRSTIAEDDVNTLTGQHREEKVFAVIDAVADGKPAEALAAWEQVLATDRAAPMRAVAGLAWGVRNLMDVRRAWETGSTMFELSRRLRTTAAVAERRLRRVSEAALRRQQKDLLNVDFSVKTGGSTTELAIEKFIVKHGSAGEKA